MNVLFVLAACQGDPEGPPAAPPESTWTGPPADTGVPVAGPGDCEDPLGLAPLQPGVLTLQGTQFVASGGKGPYVFSFADNASGAILGDSSGLYVAGELSGVVDVVAVRDTTCDTTATASVSVFVPLAVAPTVAELLPASAFAIEVSGGSGTWHCESTLLASGGDLAGCDYTAGSEGLDLLAVVDEGTGERVELIYTVTPDAALSVDGGVLLFPIGQRVRPTYSGGSGHFDVSVISGVGAVINDDGWLTGTAVGSVSLSVQDRFTALSVDVEAAVGSVHAIAPVPDGERFFAGSIAALGDLNGDGYDDVAVGVPEAAAAAWRSGTVAIYAGGPGGPGATPVQQLSYLEESASFGRAIVAADFDGDGVRELAVGAENADGVGVNAGFVYVYQADPATGWYDPEPRWALEGNPYDGQGYGLAVCDLDDDGYADLLASSLYIDWYDGVSWFYDTGGFRVFRGGVGGLSAVASWTVNARLPSGGAFVDQGALHVGRVLATGDWTGDGRCDVAASQTTWPLLGAGQTGGIWLWDGVEVTGGASPLDPIRVLTIDPGTDTQVQLGRALRMADLDGDGQDDVVASAWFWAESGLESAGGVFGWLAGEDPGGAPGSPNAAYSWKLTGAGAWDYFGSGLELADATGDGDPDVIVGAGNGELSGGTSGTGAVFVYDGTDLAAGAVRVVPGAVAGSWFGTAVGRAGDLDGDAQDDLVTLASLDRTWANETGAPWWIPGDPAGVPAILELPVTSSGAAVGSSNALLLADFDGSGGSDLWIGAWGAGDPVTPYGYGGPNAGEVHVFADDGPGFSATAEAFDADWPTRTAFEGYGYALSTAGDFDGDGFEDLAVAAYSDGIPSTFDALVYDAGACLPNLAGTGAVWVHRGGPAGVDPVPSFVMYGYGLYDRVESLTGGFDHDGDGYDDLAYGSIGYGSSDVGGFSIAYGRAAPVDGRIRVLCDEEDTLGWNVYSYLGISVSAAGDIDGDGCDELAVGADAEDWVATSNQGSVRVVWGWGSGCRGSPQVTTAYVADPYARLGHGLAAGRDVDGDGVPDVAVGAWDYGTGGTAEVGLVALLSGSWLASLPVNPLTTPLPIEASTALNAIPLDGRVVVGPADDWDFGWTLALVPNPADPSRALVAVGAPFGDLGGTDRSGGVRLYGWRAGALDPSPVATVLGETAAPNSELGSGLWAGPGPGATSWLLVGAPMSDVAQRDAGAVYAFSVEAL